MTEQPEHGSERVIRLYKNVYTTITVCQTLCTKVREWRHVLDRQTRVRCCHETRQVQRNITMFFTTELPKARHISRTQTVRRIGLEIYKLTVLLNEYIFRYALYFALPRAAGTKKTNASG